MNNDWKILSTTGFQRKIHDFNKMIGEQFVIVHIRTGKILGAVKVIEAPEEVHGSVDELTFRRK